MELSAKLAPSTAGDCLTMGRRYVSSSPAVTVQRVRGSAVPTYCECGDHAFANLTKGHVVLVSPQDAGLLTNYWCATVKKNGYAMVYRSKGIGGGKHKTTLIAREISQPSGGQQVDHINLDPTDNRRQNLRVCTPGENRRNNRVQPGSRTGFKGVRVSRSGKQFEARIKLEGKRHHLGTFVTIDEARLAYAVAAYWFHGKFARVA